MGITNSIRAWNSYILNVDADPTIVGVSAGIDSIAITQYGAIYKKTGPLDTNWTLLTVELGPTTPAGYYGDFYSDATQNNMVLYNPVKVNNTTLSNGVSVVAQSQITVANSGIYNIQFSLQVSTTSGSDKELFVWLRKMGMNVPYTNTQVDIQGGSKKAVAAWNFVVKLGASEHVQLIWYSTDANMTLVSVPPSMAPMYPGIPSVILNVSQIAGA